jgi:hypothetical protein
MAVRTTKMPVGCADKLRQAAQAVLAVWDARVDCDEGLGEAMDGPLAGLKTALASTPASSNARRQPNDTKQARVITMLGREGGATGAQIAEAMGWAPHTVRGFLAGLAKKGIHVEVLDRVRRIGPDKQGAKGSYTVYRVSSEVGKSGNLPAPRCRP